MVFINGVFFDEHHYIGMCCNIRRTSLYWYVLQHTCNYGSICIYLSQAIDLLLGLPMMWLKFQIRYFPTRFSEPYTDYSIRQFSCNQLLPVPMWTKVMWRIVVSLWTSELKHCDLCNEKGIFLVTSGLFQGCNLRPIAFRCQSHVSVEGDSIDVLIFPESNVSLLS